MAESSNTSTVYLSVCGENQQNVRNELASVIERAGLQITPTENSSDVSAAISKIKNASCSVHILFPEYAPLTISDPSTSIAKMQFFEAKKHLEENPNFKMFIWMPPTTSSSVVENLQNDFINEVRNNITKNMVFSTASSAIQLVDDIRSLMETKELPTFDLSATDIFLISNQIDEVEAEEIVDMLTDIVPVENLNIIQDNDTDYSELCKQQIPQSKLAVVYYKHTSDWALPFAQQVWKKIGGASSPTPILLIGDEDPNADDPKQFNAPKVISMIVAGELIPLEIKVQFDKVAG
jgi:hypothetical protein